MARQTCSRTQWSSKWPASWFEYLLAAFPPFFPPFCLGLRGAWLVQGWWGVGSCEQDRKKEGRGKTKASKQSKTTPFFFFFFFFFAWMDQAIVPCVVRYTRWCRRRQFVVLVDCSRKMLRIRMTSQTKRARDEKGPTQQTTRGNALSSLSLSLDQLISHIHRQDKSNHHE